MILRFINFLICIKRDNLKKIIKITKKIYKLAKTYKKYKEAKYTLL